VNDKNNERDFELDGILRPLLGERNVDDDPDILRWRFAVRRALATTKTNKSTRNLTPWLLQIAAAIVVGIAIGATAFKYGGSSLLQNNLVVSSDNFLPSATIEHVFVKSTD
jgi:hypothetical protein